MRAFNLWGKRWLSFFRRNQAGGAATVEAVLWLPAFAILLALIADAASVYGGQARALRVVQDANRSMSIGRFRTIDETERFIRGALSTLSPNAAVETVVVSGVIITTVTLPVSDLSPTRMLGAFTDLRIGVRAQHVAEI
jgi:Flp pilus assembly protein TadG